MQRPEITRSDVNLRLFIDTNVLIDYVEQFDERKSKTFIELFRKNNFDNIELITSDYVLWEFYGHFKDELYIRKLVNDHNYGHIGANRECRRGDFRKASLEDMKTMGDTIESYVEQFEENPLSVQRLINRELHHFSDMTEAILRCSKFSYKDTIVFVSALFTRSHIIITLDETFSSERHLEVLKEALKDLKTTLEPFGLPIDIEFCKPTDFSSENSVKKNFKAWFLKNNRNKQLGKVINVWPKRNVLGIQCLRNFSINLGDYLCLTKFVKGIDFRMKIFEVTEGNLRDYDTNQEIIKGSKVTVKLPLGIKCEPWQEAMVFLYSG